MSDPPPYWRRLYVGLRPVLYGLLASLDRFFEIESKHITLIIDSNVTQHH